MVVAILGTAYPATAHVPNSPLDKSEPLPESGALVQQGCREVFAFPQVPYEQAAALVADESDKYKVARFNNAESGPARLLINVRYCEKVNVDGVEVKDAIDSYMNVFLDPTSGPPRADKPHESFIVPWEELGEVPGDEGIVRLEAYLVQWVTNNELHAEWLKKNTGLGGKVRVIPDLVYDGGSEPFRFRVPPPAPSPFHIEATVAQLGHPAWDVGLNLWTQTPDGRSLNIFAEHYKGADNVFGTAEGSITSDRHNSPLGLMFGSEQTYPLVPKENPELGRFSSATYTNAQWLKCIRDAANPCDDH